MKPARIGIYLKNGGTHSGPGRYVRSLLNAANPDEFEMAVLGQSSRIGAIAVPDAARPARSLARQLTPFAVKYWLGFNRETRRLSESMRAGEFDLLHTNDTGCEESALAARLAGVPVVLGTLHVLPDVDVERQRRRWVHRQLARRGVNALDQAIAVSDAARDAWMRYSGLSASRIVTIHNGINPQGFQRRRPAAAARAELGLPIADGSIVIGTVARLSRVKGLEYLIEAAARLRTQGLNIRVLIAGDGELLGELREQADRIGAASCVHFVGHQADVPAVLEALDIFAIPSLSEALPYAVMEAMAMELPVVGSDVGGVPEIVAADQTGLLVPARDSEALAVALRRLVDSADLRERMGRAGRQRIIDHFDERRMAEQTLGVYRSALRAARATQGVAA